MLPGMELMGCQGLAVPPQVMHHVVRVESSYNPYAIGVVGGRLVRQPRNLPEALATVRMLERRGFNFSIGLAQVNRYNLDRYGLDSYEEAFAPCANLQAGSRILAECYQRAERDWGKSFSCYYSGNFTTGFRQGYVQKIYASLRESRDADPGVPAIGVVSRASRSGVPVASYPLYRRAGSAPQSAAPPTTARWMSRVEPVPSRGADGSSAIPSAANPVPASASVQTPPSADAPEARFLEALQTAQPVQVPQPAPDIGRAVPTALANAATDVGRAVVVPASATALPSAPNGRVQSAPHPSVDRARIAGTPAEDSAFVF